MIREWMLAETNLRRAKQRGYEVAVLPLGAIEAHNRHLPYGQDWLHTSEVAERVCALAFARGAGVVCLPALPYGVDCNLLDYPLVMHVSQASLDAVVRDLVVSLRRHGIRKVLLINGHGGNDFTPLVRQLQCDLDVHIFVSNWWTVGHDRYDEFFDRPDDHAGQFETSVALHLYPHLVEAEQAGSGAARPFRLEALNRGYVRTSRNFGHLNDHCACGDPRGANAERGRAYLDLVCQRLADFVVELAATPIDETFPLA